MSYNDSTLTAFDFFAGGGGASLGLHRAGINVLAALNHSPVAIDTHGINFPGARHLLCDIRTQKSWGLGHADIMWASPDCTHHSIAKGGQSRDAKERALAEELPRFAYNLNVNCIMVENVKEFLQWGPVMEKDGKMLPDPTRKGEHYRAWLASLAELGFVHYEYRLLNSADFGAPQSRVRYFGIFTRKGVAIHWPQPTHDKHGKHGLPKWVAVRTVLDLDDRGRSIFTAWGKPIADKTLRRILAGLKKHVIGKGQGQFLDKRTSNPPSGKPGTGASINETGPTVATCYLPDLVTPVFLAQYNGGSDNCRVLSLDGPCNGVPTENRFAAVQCLLQANGTRANDDPGRLTMPLGGQAPTINTNGGNLYLMSYYGNGSTRPLCHACPTLSTHDRFALLGFVTGSGYGQRPYPFSRPASPIVASRRHQYLVLCAAGSAVATQPGDSQAMRLLKVTCRRHGIADIFMRMLKVSELKLIMGFPADYFLSGSATKQKEMLGNAVVPQVSEAIARAMLPSLHKARLRKLPALRRAAVNRYEQGQLFGKEVACA
ncbi:DNA cytosine methyltransferase [Hymenobacter algoricola]|uniref:DNA (cytosine-5-)-methyltransferase n=1 Tax=Hymenobacter algoricola TaxID=486267 RepID=A0ABP7NA17_9BACT